LVKPMCRMPFWMPRMSIEEAIVKSCVEEGAVGATLFVSASRIRF